MGKTKIKVIDDSVANQESKIKNKEKKVSKKEKDTLVAKLKEELGIEELEKVESGREGRLGKNKDITASADQTPHVIASEATPEAGEARQSIVEDRQSPSGGPPIAPRDDKVKKPGKTKPRSKKYLEATKNLDRTKFYPLDSALDMVKKMSYAKFNATIEAHINTMQTGLRGFISLPFASGKKLRILIFGPSQLPIEGVVFGADSTLEDIEKGLPVGRQGKVDFDLIIATPEWMPKLAKVAKVLGPKGLMPNPKNGTIVNPSADGLKKAVESFQAGKTEYKTEAKAPVIHLALGKLSQPNAELMANVKTLLATLGKTRIKKVILSPTMGPGVKLDLSSF